MAMRDRDIRDALRELLDQQHGGDPDTLVLDELGVCEGAARTDVAVINGSLSAFEIKSDRDTLARLPGQVAAYDRVFDHVTIIVGERYAEKIADAVPEHWGIVVASETGGAVGLAELRTAAANPGPEPYAVAQLLWRDEALELLTAHSLDKGLRSKPRRALWAALAEGLPLSVLQDAVRAQLRSRAGWRSDPPPTSGDGSLRTAAS